MNNEETLHVLFENTYDLISIADENLKTLWANPAWKNIFGSESEYTDNTVTNIHPDDRDRALKAWQDLLVNNNKIKNIHYRYKMPDGYYATFETSAFPINDIDEKRYYIIARDITERKKTEKALEKALLENKYLLKELQHRVKNSFSMITSMIMLLENKDTSTETRAVLSEIELRVRAVSEMYDLLYLTDTVTEVQLDKYLNKLIVSLPHVPDTITLTSTLDIITMPTKGAIPIGIIVTELLTNCFKHAFPGNRKGSINYLLKKTPTGAYIEISDDGIGLPENFDISTVDSLGLILVHSLSEQINGNLTITNDNGTRCLLKFPITKE